MTHCLEFPKFEDRLNDYSDDLLAPPARAEVDRHLRECAGCRDALAALRSLKERAATLPRSLEPPRNLWLGIEASLPPRRGGAFALFRWLFARRAEWRLALAGAAAFLAVAVAVFVALRRESAPELAPDAQILTSQASPSGPTAGQAAGGASEQAALRLVEAEYRSPTEQLQAALLRETSRPSPEAVRVLEENLKIVNGAILEVHRAAEEDPGRVVEEQFVAKLYKTRFELLRQAVRLASREGEEKKS
jgi:anti-sigma factor RsiW